MITIQVTIHCNHNSPPGMPKDPCLSCAPATLKMEPIGAYLTHENGDEFWVYRHNWAEHQVPPGWHLDVDRDECLCPHHKP
jgi:hypothetical protein